jgi:2-polyprenyl-3-methyl-5-hydroxy-6-metoxy-1,4-benzoquinol methylase
LRIRGAASRYVLAVAEAPARQTIARAGDAAVPRLIEWTGERCVPWAEDSAMLYEHFHRYLWAARLLAGATVLDLGSGEGFGAAILAESAASVIGVDVDAAAVAHATANYSRPNLSFEQASAVDLSRFQDGSFAAVTAFEMIEHIGDPERVISEVQRVLADDGLLIVSTPDKDVYSEASGQVNPYHERELSVTEFRGMLAARFEHVAVWGQRTITGSYMNELDPRDPDSSSPTSDFFVRRSPEGGLYRIEAPPAIFCVALASNSALPAAGRSSTLLDDGLELLHETARAHAVAVAERDRLLSEVHELLTQANRGIDEKREEVLAVARRLTSVEAQLLQSGEQLAAAREQLAIAHAALTRIDQSVSWQLFQRARRALYGLVGEDSRLGRGISRLLLLIGRLLPRSRD